MTPYKSEVPSPIIPTHRERKQGENSRKQKWTKQLRPIKNIVPALNNLHSHNIKYLQGPQDRSRGTVKAIKSHVVLRDSTAIDHIICLFQIHKHPEYIFPMSEILFTHLPYSKTWSMHPLPCLNRHCSSPIALSVRALTLLISTLPYNLPTTLN